MELSPQLYHHIVRPKWFTKLYIGNIINRELHPVDKIVLDFGSGTGSSCSIFEPENYLGVDIDLYRVDYAKRLYPDYRFSVLNDTSLPVVDNYFDCIIIVAVLHHISNEKLRNYQQEFHRTLKPDGQILIIEPCYCKKSIINNNLMRFFDNGKFIRSEKEYLELFDNKRFQTRVIRRFKKVFYNEIILSAKPVN